MARPTVKPEIVPLNEVQSTRASSNARPQPDTHPDSEHASMLAEKYSKSRTDWITAPWLLEGVAWCLSLILYLAVVIVLLHYNGKAVPEWRYNFQLNAIVGLLASLANALLAVPATSVLGQAKWLWFRQKRPLYDFARMDDASRGAWGSLQLLASRKSSAVGLVTAAVLVLALFTSTFVQQSIHTYTYHAPSGGASMPIARSVPGDDLQISPETSSLVEPILEAGAYLALLSPPSTHFNTTPTCSSSDCTWSSYYSLGICNQCADITSQLVNETVSVPESSGENGSDAYYNNIWTLPNGFQLSGVTVAGTPYLSVLNVSFTRTHGLTIPDAPVPEFSSVAFANTTASRLFSVLAIGSTPQGYPASGNLSSQLLGESVPYAPPVAYECLMRWCLREYDVTFRNGSLEETVVNTFYDERDVDTIPNGDALFNVTPPGSGDAAYVVRPEASGLASSLFTILRGNVKLSRGKRPLPQDLLPSSTPAGAIHAAMTADRAGFPHLMRNLADSLSVAMRTSGSLPAAAAGTSYASETRYGIVFAWLTFPFALLAACLVVFAATVVVSRRENLPAWTNGSLAVMFHGLDPARLSGEEYQLLRSADMDAVAERLEVEFAPDERGGRRLVS